MGFMRPVAERFAAYHVEMNCGTEIVPCDVAGPIDLDADDVELYWSALSLYLEGASIEDIERREGWYARLSAPGYLDCTEWSGPYATADAALSAVKDLYDVDDEGECASDGPECGHSACRQNWIDTGETECVQETDNVRDDDAPEQ